MASIDPINVGTVANDNTGDTLRAAFQKVNGNFSALNDALADKADIDHTHSLDGLSDVTITSPALNHFLVHNGTNFVNQSLSTIRTSLGIAALLYSGTITTAPTGSGEDSIVIGDGAIGGAAASNIVIGKGATASAAVNASNIAIGTSANTSSSNANGSIAIGLNSLSQGANGSVALGYNAYASSTSTVAIGYSASVNNNQSVALGGNATASDQQALALGYGATASGTGSVALGQGSTANGKNSCALGQGSNTNSKESSAAFHKGKPSSFGALAYQPQSTNFPNTGEAQWEVATFYGVTTTSSQAEIFTDGNSTRMAMPNDTTWNFDVTIIARNTANDETARFKRSGLIRRGANASSTTLVGSVDTIGNDKSESGASTWAVSVEASTSSGALVIKVTGENSKTIRWVAKVETVEVTG